MHVWLGTPQLQEPEEMFENPPREKQWVSWLYVMIWSVIIFGTIPLARSLQKVVQQQWGRQTFTYTVIAAIVIAFVAAAVYVLRHRPAARGSYFWLLSAAAVFFGYTLELGEKSPEEALHFIQYGVLGVLVYRALTHSLHDTSIYIAAALICGILGMLDEVVQWLTPRRYWGLRDIWINFFAAALVLISIAKGLQPKFIKGRPSKGNFRFVCRLAVAAVGLLAVCLLNTPARIAWYAERISWLAFLKVNESVMLEYGYRYEDSDIGIFQTRCIARPIDGQKTTLPWLGITSCGMRFMTVGFPGIW